jgi:two-component system LytT family response regulator
MIRCCIIDDEPMAIRLLADYVEKVDDLELVAEYSNPIQAIQEIMQAPVDLIFLDVQMPELSGLQFMKILGGKSKVILTTAYSEYALEGYDYDVVDYLLKPVSLDRFLQAVEKARQRLAEGRGETPGPTAPPSFIWVKSEYKHLKIRLDEIRYLESLGDYVAIHLSDKKVLTLQNMKQFEQELPENLFVRIHKSYLVSLEKIDYIERNRVVIGEKYLPVGNTYQKRFWELIQNK